MRSCFNVRKEIPRFRHEPFLIGETLDPQAREKARRKRKGLPKLLAAAMFIDTEPRTHDTTPN